MAEQPRVPQAHDGAKLATYDPKSPAAFSGSEQSGLLAASQLLEAPSLGASPQNKLTTFFGLWNHPFQMVALSKDGLKMLFWDISPVERPLKAIEDLFP